MSISALIGGADVFTVHPYDVLTKPTEQSIRIARNVVLVLKEESFVEDVIDPSGGSYFIETLTSEYVEKAWELFFKLKKQVASTNSKNPENYNQLFEEVY